MYFIRSLSCKPIWQTPANDAASTETSCGENIDMVLRQLKKDAASAYKKLVPRAEYGRTSCKVRPSPARGTTFSSTRDGLRMQLFDYQRPLSAIDNGS